MIRFPDASHRETTELRARHTLELGGRALEAGGTKWFAPGITARWAAPEFRIEVDADCYYLRHDLERRHYSGGGWPHGVATGFILRRLDDERLLLEVWDVAEAARGPLWVDGVDG